MSAHYYSHLDFLRKENPWLASESSSLAASPSFFFRLNMRLNMLFGGFGGLPAAGAHVLVVHGEG